LSKAEPGARGFSLVETLVALFVLSIVGVALAQMQTQSLSTQSIVETRALAELTANNRLVETLASRSRLEIGSTTGEVDMAGKVFRWRLDVADTDNPGTLRLTAQAGSTGASPVRATVSAFGPVEPAP
jgi:general secretion pathway protein I